MVGDLVMARGERSCVGFVEVEAVFFLSLVGPHHLQIFDVKRKISRVQRRSDLLLYRAGPGERVYVPKAAKLGRPKVDGVPRHEKKETAAGPSCGRKEKNSSRRKVAAPKPKAGVHRKVREFLSGVYSNIAIKALLDNDAVQESLQAVCCFLLSIGASALMKPLPLQAKGRKRTKIRETPNINDYVEEAPQAPS
eukprot:s2922_g8.t1